MEKVATMRTHSLGSGEPLLLIGGGLTGWQSWTPHQERLAESRLAVRVQPLIVQLGLDDLPVGEGYSVKRESAALAAAANAVHATGPLDVVAWSYGGHVALDFALDNPERVRTLTLIEPPAFWVLQALGDPLYESERQVLQPLADSVRDDVSEADLVAFVRYASIGPPDVAPQTLPQWPVWMEHRRSLRGQFDAEFNHRDTIERLRQFDRPVLLVKGRGSTPALHRITDGLATTLPRATLVEFDGRHAPHIVEMDAFLDALKTFLATPSTLDTATPQDRGRLDRSRWPSSERW